MNSRRYILTLNWVIQFNNRVTHNFIIFFNLSWVSESYWIFSTLKAIIIIIEILWRWPQTQEIILSDSVKYQELRRQAFFAWYLLRYLFLKRCYAGWDSDSIKVFFLKILLNRPKGSNDKYHKLGMYVTHSLKIYTQLWIVHNLFNLFICNVVISKAWRIYWLLCDLFMIDDMSGPMCVITLKIGIVMSHRSFTRLASSTLSDFCF